jgi:DNA primase
VRFDVVVLMFDADKPGRRLLMLLPSILPVGKVYVAKLPGWLQGP